MFEDDEATILVPTFAPGFFFADRYRVDALLGSGAIGRVYACTELHSERQVAVKVLHPDRLGEDETVARFRREAEVLASIGHACIVEIHAFHETSAGIPYLAMELLEGVTLKTRLTSGGRFDDPRDFQPILDCIAAALEAAHGHGVVHRDLKPDNVFLPATGVPRAKLLDFGLSRMVAQRKELTQRGMLLGTPRYMAPEQVRNAAEAGPGVDVYSVGVLIYESLTGQSPYPAQDYGQLLGCVLGNRVSSLEKVRPDLPPSLAEVVRGAMHPDPAQRTASAGALADAFGAAIGSPSRRAAIAPRPSRRPRRITSSNQGLNLNKAQTLALDLSAASPGSSSAPPPAPAGATPRPDPEGLPPSNAHFGDGPPGDARPGDARSGEDEVSPAFVPFDAEPPPVASLTPAHPQGPEVIAPAEAVSSAPPASKGRGATWLIVFTLALILVLGSCAAGGFALRTLMRGELPFGL